MPDIIKVQVRAETNDAEEKLKRAQALADSLGAKQTTIKVDSKSIDGAAKSVRVLQNDLSKFKMSADVFNAYINGSISLEEALKGVQVETKQTSSVFDKLAQRLTLANLASAAITRGITLLRNSLRQAVDEMKEMDKALTTIQMVTGATSSQIAKIRNSALQSAGETGRNATDYLAAYERFARAGYRGNIEELTKLSLITQNVGGVTEETASRFILAADAAWKFEGSATQLSAALDGVVSVSDQNATDLSKIAEGITIAGSAFANAGESIQSFTAMLGVTTAATQRSGGEMARGLQTILFRVRQVKGELDDGEIINADDISNAAKALDSVGISVLNDAKELKSFSEIMGELSEKWDTLDSKQKSYLQNALAGNRRGNILYTLMDNWGEYEKMLGQYSEGAGAALAKNEKYLDSWEAKTNKLKTTWTQFVSNTLSSNMFKGFLDGINFVLKAVGNLGNAIPLVISAFAILKRQQINDTFAKIAASMSQATGNAKSFSGALSSIGKSLLSPAGVISAVGLLISGIKMLKTHMQNARKEMMQLSDQALDTAINFREMDKAQKALTIEKVRAGYEAARKELRSLPNGLATRVMAEALKFGIDASLPVEEKVIKVYERSLAMLEKLYNPNASKQSSEYEHYARIVRSLEEPVAEFNKQKEAYFAVREAAKGNEEALDALIQKRNGEKEATKESTDAVTENEEALDSLDESLDNVGESEKETTKEVEELTNAFDKQKDKINAVSEAIKKERDDTIKAVADIYKAMNDAAEKGYYGSTAYRNGIKLLFGTDSRDKIKKEAKEAVDTYVKEIEKGDYSNAAANLWRKVADEDGNIRDSAGNIIASMEQVGDEFVWTFDKTGQGMENFLKAMEDATGIGAGFWAAMMESFGMYTDALDNWIGDNTDIETNFVANTDEATKATEGYIGVIESVPTEVTTVYHAKYETDGESGTSGTVPHHAKGKRNGYSGISVVNDEYPADGSKPELIISRSTGRAYIANGGKPALVNLRHDDIVLTASETRSAMGGIPAFADGKEEDPYDTQNIDSLLTQVTTPADTTNNGGNGGGKKKPNPEKAWEELKKLIDYLIEHAENDLKEKLKVLDQQLAALEAEWKAQKEANELADKQLAVDNALLDLQKAQTERTVRYYNEETQQWEWMADQGSVNDAQKAYEDANKELADYLAEQEYERKREEIENRKNELQEQFDAMTDAWSEIVDAIEAPSGDLQQLLNTIMNNGSGTLLEQSGSIADLLNALSSGLFNSGYLDGLFKINGNTENSTTTADTTFDKGGFAYGRGFMRKGSETETVIGPDITSAILDPVKNERFSSFADSLRFMTGNESPIFKGQSNITNNNGGNYYVNGIKIGHDMAQMPFVEVMRTIAIHANETA